MKKSTVGVIFVIVMLFCLIAAMFFILTGQKDAPKVDNKVKVEIPTSRTAITAKGYVVQGHDQCYRTYYILKTADDKEYRLALSKSIDWLEFHKHSIRRDDQRILEIQGDKGIYNGDELIFVVGFKLTDETVSHPEAIDLVYTGERLEQLRGDFKVKIFDDKLKNVLTVGNKDYETVCITISQNRISFSGTKMGVYPPKTEFITSVNVTQSDFDTLLKYSDNINKIYEKIK